MDTVLCASSLNVGEYLIEVKIHHDDYFSPLHYTEEVEQLADNPFGNCNNIFDYTDFGIDNHYHQAYFTALTASYPTEPYYFGFLISIKDLQMEYSKIGYSKHEAWLKSLEYLRNKARYVQAYFNDELTYVGIETDVTKTSTDESGLIWSAYISHDALWAVEWSTHFDDDLVNNEQQFKSVVSDMLPLEKINLTKQQLHDLWLDLI